MESRKDMREAWQQSERNWLRASALTIFGSALLCAAVLFSSGATAEILERKVAGIWKTDAGGDRSDTIRIMKRHIFERHILTYQIVEVEKPDGDVLVSRQITGRTIERGRWQVVENRIRLQFNREVDGVKEAPSEATGEAFHTSYLGEANPNGSKSQALRLVLDEMDGRKLEGAERLIYERESK